MNGSLGKGESSFPDDCSAISVDMLDFDGNSSCNRILLRPSAARARFETDVANDGPPQERLHLHVGRFFTVQKFDVTLLSDEAALTLQRAISRRPCVP